MTSTPGEPPLRVGSVERESAIKALDEHLAAGRIDVQEYADRTASAANAKVAAELNKLFADLPAPHPDLSAVAPVPPAQQSCVLPAARPVATEPDAAPARRDVALFGRVGSTLVAISPIVALALFFSTGNWIWFLLIPAVGALIYGGGKLAT